MARWIRLIQGLGNCLGKVVSDLMTPKLIAVLALFLGEALCIYSEMIIARGASWGWSFFLITLAGIPLLYGYRTGYESFGNMWPVAVASLVSILIVEPLLIWGMFADVPSKNSLLGLLFGLIGLFFVLKD